MWMLIIMQTEFRLRLPNILIMLEAQSKEYISDHRIIKNNEMITLNVA